MYSTLRPDVNAGQTIFFLVKYTNLQAAYIFLSPLHYREAALTPTVLSASEHLHR